MTSDVKKLYDIRDKTRVMITKIMDEIDEKFIEDINKNGVRHKSVVFGWKLNREEETYMIEDEL